ncbi:hypothetical protein I7I48_05400 [Histoplasma ohiense]|nr:hypothetical protein I7I48_05400 [Histoplasma ohiense (nom. inval.)]
MKSNAQCGLSYTRVQQQDHQFLFINQLHINDILTAEKISTLFVRQCIYFAFFGKSLTSSL